jgi:hypothetical protein
MTAILLIQFQHTSLFPFNRFFNNHRIFDVAVLISLSSPLFIIFFDSKASLFNNFNVSILLSMCHALVCWAKIQWVLLKKRWAAIKTLLSLWKCCIIHSGCIAISTGEIRFDGTECIDQLLLL